MPLDPVLEYGKRKIDLQNEPGLMVDKLSLKPMRDETIRKGAERTSIYMRYDDPRIEGELGGRPFTNGQGNTFGLGNIHPGVATDLVNVADGTDIHGFVIDDDNLTVIGNPSTDKDDGTEGVKVSVPWKHMPFIAKPTTPPPAP